MTNYCPSKDWDRHCEDEQRAESPSDEELIEKLDAYGHLTWVVGYGDDGDDDDRGDWLACFDFFIHTNPDGDTKVAYQVVVNSDSGGFIESPESGVVPADKAPFDLPDYWASIGMDGDPAWTDEEIKDSWTCNEQWNKALKEAIERELTNERARA